MKQNLTQCFKLISVEFRPRLSELLILLLLLLSPNTSRAEINSDGLHTGDDVSFFTDKTLTSSSTSNSVIRMETLWEIDMSQAYDGAAATDPNQNNHNLIVIGDKIYTYVETYKPSGICLRRFDSNTGYELEAIQMPFPETISDCMTSLLSDDAGHLVLVGNKYVVETMGGLVVKAVVFDTEMNTLKEVLCSTTSIGAVPSHHFMRNIDFHSLDGNATAANFKINFGAYHYYCEKNNVEPKFYPSICTISINVGDEPTVNLKRLNDGEDFSYGERPYQSFSTEKTEGLLSFSHISNDVILVQAFGTVENPLSHSPILRYKSGTSTDNRWAESPYPVLEQRGAITDKNFKFKDPHCFGVFPVKVGDEQLLVLPYKFNSRDGVKFKVAHWGGDHSSFDHLTELWEFPQKTYPSDCAKVFGSNNQNIYDYARPKVIVAPTNATSAGNKSANANPADDTPNKEAIIYAYMPGSLLGAYKISIDDNATPSNIISRPEIDGVKINFNHKNQIIEITNDFPYDLTTTLYSLSGIEVHTITILTESTTQINLDQFAPGAYIFKVKDKCEKIIVK